MAILLEDHLPVVKFNGLNTNKVVDFSGATSVALPATTTIAGTTAAGTSTITSTSANALTVGRQGATDPVLKINANTASVATGIEVVGAAAAGGVNVRAISSGTNENLTINAKGSGTITLAPTSTGAVTITPATTITGALTQTGVATFAAAAVFSAGFTTTAQAVNPSNDSGVGSTILVGSIGVAVGAVVNDANDWIVLPAIASCPIGHQIRISCNAGGNFELRTPASSNTKINDIDADGSQEYLCTDTDLVIVTKHTTTSWVAQSLTKLGAVRTAVIPD